MLQGLCWMFQRLYCVKTKIKLTQPSLVELGLGLNFAKIKQEDLRDMANQDQEEGKWKEAATWNPGKHGASLQRRKKERRE